MGHLEAAHLEYYLPDGRALLGDVSFRVGEGAAVALVGPNGAGKTTLLRLISGELKPHGGTVTVSGGLGVMRQFVGSVRDETTVRDLLVSVAPPRIREAAEAVDRAEHLIMTVDDEAAQLKYAQALSDWAEARGYEAETLWDMCTTAALGVPYEKAQFRQVGTLSGGEQKRLVLEALLRGTDEVLLLDEPDNYLDVPGKRWLEERLKETRKTVLFVSHDRELLARSAEKIVSVEPSPAGADAWVHGGGFATYHDARRERFARFEELRRRWDEKHAQLKKLVLNLRQAASISHELASRYQAAQTRLRKFEEAGPPPEPPREQDIRMRLKGGRTGVRAVTCKGLELTGLMKPFDLEVFYGERVAVLGSNGSGKSHFLRLLAGGEVAHTGSGSSARGSCPGTSPRRTPTPSSRAARCSTSSGRSTPRTGARRCRACAATSSPARPSRPSTGSPAASRPASRSCCWNWRASPPCSSTSRPTTSTWSPRRRSRRAWRPSTAPCSRSRTTAGSPAPSTATWSSAATAASARPPSPCGMSVAWSGRGSRRTGVHGGPAAGMFVEWRQEGEIHGPRPGAARDCCPPGGYPDRMENTTSGVPP